MNHASLVERLAALTALSDIPRQQLEWLAAHGRLRHFAKGDLMFPKGHPIQDLWVALSGNISVRVERAGMARKVKEWKAGDISGLLPYSRMTQVPGDVMADEAVELLMVAREDVREMTRECYELTSLCVHEMVDRARLFKSYDLHLEKMASLGRLSAGLAHELNNPSSAVARSAKELAACRLELVTASRDLGALPLTAPQRAAVKALEETAARTSDDMRSPLARADREDSIHQWFDDHGLDTGVAEAMADSAVTLNQLDETASVLEGPQLEAVLKYVAADVTVRRLTAEIEMAASRIHSLVAAVKNYSHMDRAPVVEAVHLEDNLTDTITLLRGKARSKAIMLELIVEPNLPDVQGVGGELNQVWMNLVDNAIDAAPEGGHVTVATARDRECVVVKVIDDGKGIAEEDLGRIFEPFFTTKPVGEGTGLGLDIAQGVVHRHSGSIEVSSRPGHTEFRVRFPIAGASR